MYTFKFLKGMHVVKFLDNMYKLCINSRTRASSKPYQFIIPHRHISTAYTRSFEHRAIRWWNARPDNIVFNSNDSVVKFKNSIIRYIVNSRNSISNTFLKPP